MTPRNPMTPPATIETARQHRAETLYRRLDHHGPGMVTAVRRGLLKYDWTPEQIECAFDDLRAADRIEFYFGGEANITPMVSAVSR
jgi:hypothetical protein